MTRVVPVAGVSRVPAARVGRTLAAGDRTVLAVGVPPTDALPGSAAEAPAVLFPVADRARETIQHTPYALLRQRRSVFG